MNISKVPLWLVVVSLGYLSSPFSPQMVIIAAPAKFQKSEQATFPKACGDGLDENSACGDCAYVQGVGITKGTSCGHVCVLLPAGKTDKNMNLSAQAAVEGVAPSFSACGSLDTPGSCGIDWARFEAEEYYADTNKLCGRFKNWSADRKVIFKVIVSEK